MSNESFGRTGVYLFRFCLPHALKTALKTFDESENIHSGLLLFCKKLAFQTGMGSHFPAGNDAGLKSRLPASIGELGVISDIEMAAGKAVDNILRTKWL
ncbi:MAG: hypothetical protein CSYNP_01715 [Syntrophus sp. SKADARSKE-3]|nr:hypothetical protein [Syntrophus sp. SKADARSKE-3]